MLQMEKPRLENTDFNTFTGVMVQVSKLELEKLGVLEEYLQHRNGDRFDDDGYDYLYLLQAQLIGLIK